MSTISTLSLTGVQVVSRGVNLVLSSGTQDDGEVHEFHIKIARDNVHQLMDPIRFWELGIKKMHHLITLPIDLVHLQDTDVQDGARMSRLGSGSFIVTVDGEHATLRIPGYPLELTLPMSVYVAEVMPLYEQVANLKWHSRSPTAIKSGYVAQPGGNNSFPVCVADNSPLLGKLVWTQNRMWEGAYMKQMGNSYSYSGKLKTWVKGDDGFWAATARPITSNPFSNSGFDKVIAAAKYLVVNEGI